MIAPRLQSRPALWTFLSRDEKQLRALMDEAVARTKARGVAGPNLTLVRSRETLPLSVRVWTDDYSDLFGLVPR